MKTVILILVTLTAFTVLTGCGGGASVKPDPPRGPVTMTVKWVNMSPVELASYDPRCQGSDHLFFRVLVYKQISTTNNSGVFDQTYIPLPDGKTLENCIIGEGSITGVSITDSSLGDHVVISNQKTLDIKDRLYITISRDENGFKLEISNE